MIDFVFTALRIIELGIGWIVSPSWIPPQDFRFFRWLIVPGYGYGFVLIGFLLLEWILPMQRRPLGRSAFLSGTYFVLAGKLGFFGLIVVPFMRNTWVYFGLPSLHLDRILPLPVYMLVSVVVLTFAAYWAHRLMHRVPLLWNIHKIHHSVTNLNFTSVYHHHFLEAFLHIPFTVMAVLALGTDLVAPFGLVYVFIDALAHSNVRIDLGRLGYLIATPQVHRIHHSVDPAHFNTNYSNIFMLWDHVFGTFHYDRENLPTAFGIDEDIPVSFVKQQVLPLVWIAQGVRSYISHVYTVVRGNGANEAAP